MATETPSQRAATDAARAARAALDSLADMDASDVSCELPQRREITDVPTRTRMVAVAIALMAASFILVKTGRDALYFQGGGLFDLPKAYIGIAIASVPFAMVTLRLMRSLGPRRARIVAPAVLVVLLTVAAFFVTAGGGAFMTALFMIVPLSFGVIFSLSWLLAADLLDGVAGEQLGRSYGLIGAGSILGGIVGGAAARGLADVASPRVLIWVGAGVLAASALVMLAAQLRFPPRALQAKPMRVREAAERGGGVMSLLRHRYALLLLVVAMAASLTGIFVEFSFYLAAATSDHSDADSIKFFANFYIYLNVGAFCVQVWLMPRLQRWLGVHGSLLIMPVAILGGAVAMATSPSVLVRSGVKATEGGLKASIHRSNWEQAFLPVSSEERAAAKLVIDGAAARLAEGLAASCLYVWLVTSVGEGQLLGHSTSWISYAILLTAGLWVSLTILLGRRLRGATEVEDQPRFEVPLPDT